MQRDIPQGPKTAISSRLSHFQRRKPKPQKIITMRDCIALVAKDFRPHMPHWRRRIT